MNACDHVLNEVNTILSGKFEAKELKFIFNTLNFVLADYDLVPKKELPSTENMDILHIANGYLSNKKLAGRSNRTIKTYADRIRYFVTWLQEKVGGISLDMITTNHIRRYLAEVEMNNSESYADHCRRCLNGFFQYCEEEGYLQKNPCKKISKIKTVDIIEKPFTNAEVEQIRDVCSNARELAMVDMFLSTGLRRSELVNVKIEDIDFIDSSIHVIGKGNKPRTVYMSARCLKHVNEYLEMRKDSNCEYLFCTLNNQNHINSNTVYQIIKNLGVRAGVKNCPPHRFRKWFATHMINHNVSIQDLKEIMGHASISTSEKFYIEANKDRIKLLCKQFAA